MGEKERDSVTERDKAKQSKTEGEKERETIK